MKTYNQQQIEAQVREVIANASKDLVASVENRILCELTAQVIELLNAKQNSGAEGKQISHKAGDIVLAHFDCGKNHNEVRLETVSLEEYKAGDYYNEHYQPIGVIVMEQDILPDGNEARFISLVNMSCKTPDDGTIENETLRFGGYYDEDGNGTGRHIDGLTAWGEDKMNGQTFAEQSTDETASGLFGWLPSDRENFRGDESTTSKGNYFYNDNENYLPSPYLKDGSFNPLFGLGRETHKSFLSDLDGKANTKAILKMVDGDNWLTASRLKNNAIVGNYPAAMACNRYSTNGTSVDDIGMWYLPAIGELAFLMVNFAKIQASLRYLQSLNKSLAVPLGENYSYWSSSEYSQDNAYYLGSGSGLLDDGYKNNYLLVRAFCLLPRI